MTIEVKLTCANCGASLEFGREDNTVVPCPDCLKETEKEGYNEGYKDGQNEAS